MNTKILVKKSLGYLFYIYSCSFFSKYYSNYCNGYLYSKSKFYGSDYP